MSELKPAASDCEDASIEATGRRCRMSELKQHTEQFTVEEIRLALLSPKITEALIWELTTRIDLFEHFGGFSALNSAIG